MPRRLRVRFELTEGGESWMRRCEISKILHLALSHILAKKNKYKRMHKCIPNCSLMYMLKYSLCYTVTAYISTSQTCVKKTSGEKQRGAAPPSFLSFFLLLQLLFVRSSVRLSLFLSRVLRKQRIRRTTTFPFLDRDCSR